jgi:hypothetical protein
MKTKNCKATRLVLACLVVMCMGVSAALSAQNASDVFHSNASPAMLKPGFSSWEGRSAPLDILSTGTETDQGSRPTFSLSDLHLVLGFVTVLAGLSMGVLVPERVGVPTHHALAYTTAALAASTMTVGYISHKDMVGAEFGFSSSNVHAALGIAGGSMMIAAAILAPGDGHAALGMLGALCMLTAVTWKILI